MSQNAETSSSQPPTEAPGLNQGDPPQSPSPKDSYVKLAMRNMVRKSSQSLTHFALTSAGLLAVLVGLAYLTR